MIDKYLNSRFLTLYLIPFVLGLLSTLSFQPFNLTIINLIIFPLFFYLLVFINKKSKSIYRQKPYRKNLFIFGFIFGFGFYLSGISWIANSLTFDEGFKFLIPFTIILVPLFLSLFVGLTILIVGPYINLNYTSVIIFSASIALSDYLRSYVLTGFPWNLWAYSTSSFNEFLQIINHIGLYSYNLLVITVFTFPIIIFFKINNIKKIISFFLMLVVILFLFIFGNYEINKNKKILEEANEKKYVKIISPNFNLEYGLSLKKLKIDLRN